MRAGRVLTPESSALVDFVQRQLAPTPVAATRWRGRVEAWLRRYAAACETQRAGVKVVLEPVCRRRIERSHFVAPALARELAQQPVLCYRATGSGPVRVTFTVRTDAAPHQLALARLATHLMAMAELYGHRGDVQVLYSPSGARKELPPPGVVIGPAHANSGSTLAVGCGEIECWREEEHVKVLSHELVHSLLEDMGDMGEADVGVLYTALAIDAAGCERGPDGCRTKLLPNEAYTEVMAVLWHCMFVAVHAHGGSAQAFWRLLSIERAFGALQTAKVLAHNGFSSAAELVQPVRLGGPVWRQDTAVLSYVVLKTALLHRLDAFLDLARRPLPARRRAFIELCLVCVRDARFQKHVAAACRALHAAPAASFVRTTLRFTAVSLA